MDGMVSVWHPALGPNTGEPAQRLPATRGPEGPGAESCVPRPRRRFPGERWPVAAPWGCLPPGLHLPRGPPSTCAFCFPTCGAAREDRGGQKVELAFLEGRADFLLLASCRCPRPLVPASCTAPSVPASSVPVAELPAGCLLRFRLRRAPPASGASLLSFSLKMKLSVYREPDRLGG